MTGVSVNPMQTTNAAGLFSVQSNGLIQGMAMDDPAIRFALVQGLNADTALPLFGGMGIYEKIPAGGENVLGSSVGRATSLASTLALLGFTVFNQAHAGISTPQSPVPQFGNGQSVNYYRLGSGARIAVKADPSLLTLAGGLTSQQVSWDFTNQLLQPYSAGATIVISTATWASTSGGQLSLVTGSAHPYGAGDTVTISGATNTGTGGTTAINASFVVVSAADNTHLVLAAPAVAGVFGTIGGSPLLQLGSGALAVKLLSIQTENCMAVDYAPATGFATWDTDACCALILI